MYDALRDVLYGDEFSVVERFEIPGRAASYAPIPRFLFNSRTGVSLGRQFNHRRTLCGHIKRGHLRSSGTVATL